MALRIHTAAPISSRTSVLTLHKRLLDLDIRPTSRWPYRAGGSVIHYGALDRAILTQADIAGSHAILVAAFSSELGGETFAEVAYALANAIPVVWTGSPPAPEHSRPGLIVEKSIDDAVTLLESWSDAIRRTYTVPVHEDRATLWRWALGERETSQEHAARVA